jgi:ubiquitin thioesterase ZRANB1
MLATLLSQIEGSGSGVKRVPSYVAPDLAADIRRHMASTVRQRKGSFPCHFVTELTTFALPAGWWLSFSSSIRAALQVEVKLKSV